MSTGPRQLALALDHAESLAREDFLERAVECAGARARRLAGRAGPIAPSMLTGPEGSGKSHLAAIWAQAAGARLIAARALDETAVPAALATGALVVEDVAAGAFDERALFHLLNLAREEEAFVLLTARTRRRAWAFAIRDLGSRLKALPVVALAPPDDALLRAVLVKLFADRQLAVDESLIGYRGDADRALVRGRARGGRHCLDEEAMRHKRPLTRALARRKILREPARA